MTHDVVKVGDTVAWADVPIGALVKVTDTLGVRDFTSHYIRLPNGGCTVGIDEYMWMPPNAMLWAWTEQRDRLGRDVVVVALGITGSETADDLKRLAADLGA